MPLFARESVGQALRLPANGAAPTAATRVRHLAEYISNSITAYCVKLSYLRCCRYRLSRPDLRRLAVESSDLPPFKKSSGFQPLLLESTQSLTIFVFKKSAVVSRR